MIFLDYINNKVYAPVEDDFGFDDAGDMDGLDDELQVEEGNAASGEGGDELYEHWKVQVDANQEPVRIDKYLADKMAYQSRNRIHLLLHQKQRFLPPSGVHHPVRPYLLHHQTRN